MIFELVHTSARRGLKPGSRGFTTVAHTRGMSPTLIEMLESMSGYRFEFSPAGPDANRNPVVRMYCRLRLGVEDFHVLSHLGPAGADYTGRANRIAHHIAITDCSGLKAGPAWLLAQPQLFLDRWDGEPRLLESRTSLPDGEVMPEQCGRWNVLTGDAGWAGEVVGRLRHDPRMTMAVLLPEGIDRLSLVAEMLSLLLPAERWDLTFATGAPHPQANGASCRLFLVAATPQARRSLAGVRGLETLDFTGGTTPAPASEEANSARTGMAIKPIERRAAGANARQPKRQPSFAEGGEATEAASVGVILQRPSSATTMRVQPTRTRLWRALGGLGLVIAGYILGQAAPPETVDRWTSSAVGWLTSQFREQNTPDAPPESGGTDPEPAPPSPDSEYPSDDPLPLETD